METLKFLGKNYLVDKGCEQCSEGSAISRVSSSEVKQYSERNQRYHFKSSEVKHRSERSQIFHFKSSEKNSVVSQVRGFLLIVVK